MAGSSVPRNCFMRLRAISMSIAPEIFRSEGSTAASAPMSPLISYAMQGLRRCWISELERYSHRFRFDAPEPRNQSIAESDAFYTLNVLLGLSQLPDQGGCDYLNLKSTYDGCCGELQSPRARTYGFGMALWAGARLGIEPPSWLIERVGAILADRRALHRLSAQDIGMLASGATAMALKEGGIWRNAAETLATCLRQHYHDASGGIFYNQGSG